ncbi:protein GlmU [Desulfoluna sp.]|uniref:protein GlmU n=1 Tax=Desulfoluna sp. TaxID=2045199 RepID=UPI0026063A33|nr:protein GlmU [Desulfoluna sp.]
MNEQTPSEKIQALLAKGVHIPAPMSIEIAPEVRVDRISGDGVTLHSGCRISGKTTFIGAGVTLGEEAPMTLDSCQLARGVRLKGGYAQKAVFLEGAQAGSGAHLREGTIFEEEASCAHTVGLKQTILLPFVTLGSLINFCDVLMTGGTSRKDHSEVGSSYIHFNYTPQQDKATASLLGNVPEGVMLDKRPIFLGGQGGLVGPSCLAFGTVVAAGTLMRKDEEREGRLHFGGALRAGSIAAPEGIYRNIKRIVKNNIHYMANLMALMAWTRHIRGHFVGAAYPHEVHEGHLINLDRALAERVKRFSAFCGKLAPSLALGMENGLIPEESPLAAQKREVIDQVEGFQAALQALMETHVAAPAPKVLTTLCEKDPDAGYLATIHGLHASPRSLGREWLFEIVRETEAKAAQSFPLIYA